MLGGYVLGILDPDERTEVERHTDVCEVCRRELTDLREMEAALGEVPPEMFLDGPPEGGDLLLQRVLRRARDEQTAVWRRRSVRIGLGVAASAAVLFAGGYLAGQQGTSGANTEAADSPAVSASASQASVRVVSATDAATKARMTVRLTPASGWVRLSAKVGGVPVGEHCRLVVVGENGERETAGSWVVPPGATQDPGKGKDTELEGSAAIAPNHVQSVAIVNEEGEQYVSVSL
nr:zf-HC2 domain-containing protein [Streptomyces thermoviolaceus]